MTAQIVVTRRSGGVSTGRYAELNLGDHVGDDPVAVADNRARVGSLHGFEPDSAVYLRQVHGAQVVAVDGVPDDTPEADAAVTTQRGVTLAVLVADCVPVGLVDRRGGVVGVAHAGWRGVVAGVVPRTVEAMRQLGALPDDLEALVGPAICGGCYEVGEEVRSAVAEVTPLAISRTTAGTPGVDLRTAVEAQLRQCGVTRVEHDRACTFEDHALYSYRRDRQTGRFGLFAWLER